MSPHRGIKVLNAKLLTMLQLLYPNLISLLTAFPLWFLDPALAFDLAKSCPLRHLLPPLNHSMFLTIPTFLFLLCHHHLGHLHRSLAHLLLLHLHLLPHCCPCWKSRSSVHNLTQLIQLSVMNANNPNRSKIASNKNAMRWRKLLIKREWHIWSL